MMNRGLFCLLLPILAVGAITLTVADEVTAADSAVPRVLAPGKLPADARLGTPRMFDDAYHPWVPPATKEAWEQERETIRERMLVGIGLWPLPPKTPLAPVIHGKIDREDYTIEKVHFASLPGHYVTGNLYRPKNVEGKVPGVLCPHGHWANGRFFELPADKAQTEQIDKGAEKFLSGAEYPLQARMVGLARMGCVVFHYDMVGYADSEPIPHRQGFTDVEANLRLQDFMGLQTFNSMRALDFLLSLPEVDAGRIGVTGASGGGTQTFMLCALDPRPAVAFPAVMVSTAMQGGCVCENASYLRIGINNIAMTALFAPKPLAMSGADDWTKEIETKGLPELKIIYSLYAQPDNVTAKAYPQFGHNYNQVAREMMYAWFSKHLKPARPEAVIEREFTPLLPAQLSVFDDQHPLPEDAADAGKLKTYLTKSSDAQFAALLPNDARGAIEYRRVVGAAARVMLDRGVPADDDIKSVFPLLESDQETYRLYRVSITRKNAGEEIPLIVLIPPDFAGTAVVWINDKGKSHLYDKNGKPTAAVKSLLAAGLGVASADVFQTGEFLADGEAPPRPKVNTSFPGYTFGYNRPLLSNRVRDILTVIGGLKKHPGIRNVHLIGTGDAGVWVLLARALASDKVEKCVVDLHGFGFSKVKDVTDPMMLPGGLKYGGIGGLAALAAPEPLIIAGTKGAPVEELQALTQVYKATGGKLTLQPESLTPEQAVEQLLK